MDQKTLVENHRAQQVEPIVYRRQVAFYETDAMGVVHHSNYLRYFEEARVHWLQERGLMHLHIPHGDLIWAVVESHVVHYRSLQFADWIEVRLRAQRQGIRTVLEYFLFCERHQGELVSRGSTILVPVGRDSRPRRPPVQFLKAIEGEPWIEI